MTGVLQCRFTMLIVMYQYVTFSTLALVNAKAMYNKYYNMALETNKAYAEQSVAGVMGCELLCLEQRPVCVAVNVYHRGTGLYHCELISQIPVSFSSRLVSNHRGKFLERILELCPSEECYNGGTCVSGSCQCTAYCYGTYCADCIMGTHKTCLYPVTVTNTAAGVVNAPVEDGWIMLMRRIDGSVDFTNKLWHDFKYGFGNILGEFWLGNEYMHSLTSQDNYKLRIDMLDSTGVWLYAEYDQFVIGPESDNYRLNIGGYSGTAGDQIINLSPATAIISGASFTTTDRDNDEWGAGNCADHFSGAWWHNACGYVMFTGVYGSGQGHDGIIWMPDYEDLSYADMKIKLNN